MSKDRYHHNKGEQDVKEGKYDPPHSRVEDLIGNIIAGESASERKDRKAYEAGRKNAKRQKRD